MSIRGDKNETTGKRFIMISMGYTKVWGIFWRLSTGRPEWSLVTKTWNIFSSTVMLFWSLCFSFGFHNYFHSQQSNESYFINCWTTQDFGFENVWTTGEILQRFLSCFLGLMFFTARLWDIFLESKYRQTWMENRILVTKT